MNRVHKRLNKLVRNANGLTLVEVLAGIVILAIAGTALLAYFSNAYVYTKGNQNKTVAVNLARYALVYFERQDFIKAKEYLTEKDGDEYLHPEITIEDFIKDGIEKEVDLRLRSLFPNNQIAGLILEPTINGMNYSVIIQLDTDRMSEFVEGGSKAYLANMLLPIKVEVSNQNLASQNDSKRNKSEVEGYLTHEEIR